MLIQIGFVILVSCHLTGCSTAKRPNEYYIAELPDPERSGVYHKVNKGETLWRIAKTYGIPIKDIIDANSIPNVGQIETDQLVFIPGAVTVKEIPFDVDERKNEFAWPVKGRVIGFFGQSGLYNSDGINIEVKEGALITSSRMGRVVFADYLPGYGHTLILDHEDGFHTVYSQNSELLVSLGDLVLKSKEIGRIGAGSNAPYCHFEIRKKTMADNPLYYLP